MRENTDKNNSEYGHFLRSVRYSNFHKKLHLDAWLGSDSTSDSDIKHMCLVPPLCIDDVAFLQK